MTDTIAVGDTRKGYAQKKLNKLRKKFGNAWDDEYQIAFDKVKKKYLNARINRDQFNRELEKSIGDIQKEHAEDPERKTNYTKGDLASDAEIEAFHKILYKTLGTSAEEAKELVDNTEYDTLIDKMYTDKLSSSNIERYRKIIDIFYANTFFTESERKEAFARLFELNKTLKETNEELAKKYKEIAPEDQEKKDKYKDLSKRIAEMSNKDYQEVTGIDSFTENGKRLTKEEAIEKIANKTAEFEKKANALLAEYKELTEGKSEETKESEETQAPEKSFVDQVKDLVLKTKLSVTYKGEVKTFFLSKILSALDGSGKYNINKEALSKGIESFAEDYDNLDDIKTELSNLSGKYSNKSMDEAVNALCDDMFLKDDIVTKVSEEEEHAEENKPAVTPEERLKWVLKRVSELLGVNEDGSGAAKLNGAEINSVKLYFNKEKDNFMNSSEDKLEEVIKIIADKLAEDRHSQIQSNADKQKLKSAVETLLSGSNESKAKITELARRANGIKKENGKIVVYKIVYNKNTKSDEEKEIASVDIGSIDQNAFKQVESMGVITDSVGYIGKRIETIDGREGIVEDCRGKTLIVRDSFDRTFEIKDGFDLEKFVDIKEKIKELYIAAYKGDEKAKDKLAKYEKKYNTEKYTLFGTNPYKNALTDIQREIDALKHANAAAEEFDKQTSKEAEDKHEQEKINLAALKEEFDERYECENGSPDFDDIVKDYVQYKSSKKETINGTTLSDIENFIKAFASKRGYKVKEKMAKAIALSNA